MQNRTFIQLAAVALGFQSAPAAAQVPVELGVELLEVHLGEGDDHLLLDSELAIGGGPDQFLLKLEGGSETRTAFDDFEVQGLYSRSVSDAIALHLGVRHDIRSGSDLTHGVFGLVMEPLPGLEAEHYFFVSQDGNLTGGGELVLGVDLAPKMVFEPRLGIGWSAQNIPAEDLGSGLTDLEASLRLRYSVASGFNVYTGVIHERLLGSTRTIAITAGDPAKVTRAILGLGFAL